MSDEVLTLETWGLRSRWLPRRFRLTAKNLWNPIFCVQVMDRHYLPQVTAYVVRWMAPTKTTRRLQMVSVSLPATPSTA